MSNYLCPDYEWLSKEEENPLVKLLLVNYNKAGVAVKDLWASCTVWGFSCNNCWERPQQIQQHNSLATYARISQMDKMTHLLAGSKLKIFFSGKIILSCVHYWARFFPLKAALSATSASCNDAKMIICIQTMPFYIDVLMSDVCTQIMPFVSWCSHILLCTPLLLARTLFTF